MTSEFRNSLPEEFVKNVISLCGPDGERWLEGLPQRIGMLEKRWAITAGTHFSNISYNYVAEAKRADGTDAVLKIGIPLRNVEIFSEAKFLRTLNGRGAIQLLREDHENQAILLERASPGVNLAQVFDGREPEAVAPAIETLKLIRSKPPADLSDVILLDEWFDGLNRHAGTRFPPDYATKALEIYERLSSQPGRIFYLHGDFHPDNILFSGRAAFKVIDPKGILGHIGYEIAVFLNNIHWWQEELPDVRARLDRAIVQFAEAFEVSAVELRQWAFSQMVLSAWWTFDEMPDIYDNEVANADIWDV